jgi:trigger factor
MEIKRENLSKGKIKLTITLSPKEMAKHLKAAFDKVAPTVKIDGFRPGSAPRKLVESAAGITRILSDGLDMAVSDSYFQTIKDEKIIPISRPKIVINRYPHYGQTEEEIKEEFEFEAEIDSLPPVTLGDYSKLKVEEGKLEKAKKEDVEKVLVHFQKQNASFNDLDAPAEKGNHVDISYEGFVKHVRIDQMCSKNHPLILGENTLIPGFEDNIIGMKKGEKKEFNIKFPKDYHAKEHAGKEATFKVELNAVREMKLSELDDKFAEKFGHKNMAELKDAIEKNLNLEMEQSHKANLENKVIEKVLPLLKVDLPEVLIDREAERILADFAGQITSRGLNFEKYLEGMKKSKEELLSEMRPQADKNVKIGLLLGKIVEEKKWDQHDPEIGRKAIDFLVKKLSKK